MGKTRNFGPVKYRLSILRKALGRCKCKARVAGRSPLRPVGRPKK